MRTRARRGASELERENASLRQAISLLHRVAILVRESVELGPTCYAVLTGVTAGVGLGFNRAMLFLPDDTQVGVLKGLAAVGPADEEEADRVWRRIEAEAPDLRTLAAAGEHKRANPDRLDEVVRALRVAASGDSPVALALRGGEQLARSATDDLEGLLHLPTAIAAPMRGREGLAGVLYADNRFTGRAPDAVARQVFAMVADHAGLALENARHYERVAGLARTDALTGLPHHGALWEALEEAVQRARTSGQPLGVAMVDLDDFKRVNDSLGHLVGDALLAAVAARLRAEVRGEGQLFRYGGEEFALVVPGADVEVLERVGERLRRAVADRPVPVGDRALSVTCTVGLAVWGPGDPTPRALVGAADEALYRAKRAGKNRVEWARAEKGTGYFSGAEK